MAIKLSDAEQELLNSARGDVPLRTWMREAALSAARHGNPGIPQPASRDSGIPEPGRRPAGPRPARKPRAAEFREPASCPPHPKARVLKGLCGACGRQVGDERVA